MPDDQNTTQNPISEENSTPPSPQEPTEPAPENTGHSEPSTMPPEALESPQNVESAVPVNSANPQNEPISTPILEEAIPLEATDMQANPASNVTNEPSVKPIPETGTAQIPVFEPLASKPNPDFAKATPGNQKDLWKRFLDKVQIGKRKKLDKVMSLFEKGDGSTGSINSPQAGSPQVTNDEVEKFLHVSDATATRYLSILEKENKIKQVGKTGKGVSYSRF